VPEMTADLVIAGAAGLMLAGRWHLADELLTAAAAESERDQAALALARAGLAVDWDMWCGGQDVTQVIETAAPLVAQARDAVAAFDLDLLRLRAGYWAELVPPDGTPPRFGPQGRDLVILESLAAQAQRLQAAAPDRGRAGWAAFWGGVIADNLREEHHAAVDLFAEALTAGEQSGDDMLTAEALRHLGYVASQDGDPDTARGQWTRSAELRQRAGSVPGALSQQVMLAGLARDAGDTAAARALAAEVHRWAAALGITRLQSQADQIASAS
jgi:hypothetical protein